MTETVHMRADREVYQRGQTWTPMCDQDTGRCAVYASAVTCADCLRLLHPGGVAQLDLVPLAD